ELEEAFPETASFLAFFLEGILAARTQAFEQLVVQGKEELAAAGVTLAGSAADELAIDPPRFVPFRAQNVQAAGLGDGAAFFLHGVLRFDVPDGAFPDIRGHIAAAGILALELDPGNWLGIAAQDDVGAAPGHVGGYGHRPAPAGLGHDFRFAPNILRFGIEDLVRDADG